MAKYVECITNKYKCIESLSTHATEKRKKKKVIKLSSNIINNCFEYLL